MEVPAPPSLVVRTLRVQGTPVLPPPSNLPQFGGLTMEKNLQWAPELLDLLHRLISMTRCPSALLPPALSISPQARVQLLLPQPLQTRVSVQSVTQGAVPPREVPLLTS